MPPQARFGYAEAAAHPLAELLACPPAIGNLLNASAVSIECAAGDTVFSQGDACKGLFVVVGGQLLRKAERYATRLTLGTVRAGELVELAAALGDVSHTYTLSAQIPSSMMMLPLQALHQAFKAYPPIRMRLLEELAREVSRAYFACGTTRVTGSRDLLAALQRISHAGRPVIRFLRNPRVLEPCENPEFAPGQNKIYFY